MISILLEPHRADFVVWKGWEVLETKCRTCGNVTEHHDDWAGKPINCLACGELLRASGATTLRAESKMSGWGIALIAASSLMLVGGIWYSFTHRFENRAPPKASIPKEPSELLREQFSVFDGSHFYVNKAIKKQLKDPTSFEHVKTEPFLIDDHCIVYVDFRSRNSFNAIVPGRAKAKVLSNGTVESLEFVGR